jgi:hypothetical protein
VVLSILGLVRGEARGGRAVLMGIGAAVALLVVGAVAALATAAGLSSGLADNGSWILLVVVGAVYWIVLCVGLGRLVHFYGQNEAAEHRAGAVVALLLAVVPVGLTILVVWGPNVWPEITVAAP